MYKTMQMLFLKHLHLPYEFLQHPYWVWFGIVRSEKEMYALVAFLANGTVQ